MLLRSVLGGKFLEDAISSEIAKSLVQMDGALIDFDDWLDAGGQGRSPAVSLMLCDLDRPNCGWTNRAEKMSAISRVSQTLRAVVEPPNFFSPLRNDEFIAAVSSDRNDALAIAERLRVKIQADCYPFTISIGVCVLEGKTHVLTVYLQAVYGLQLAKRQGKNRSALAPAGRHYLKVNVTRETSDRIDLLCNQLQIRVEDLLPVIVEEGLRRFHR